MITDEEKRTYGNSIYTLGIIKRKISELESSIVNVKDKLNKNLKIDDKVVGEKELNAIMSDLGYISDAITDNVIPSLNNKIYSD